MLTYHLCVFSFFYDGNFEAELSGPNRCHISSRSRTDYRDVKFFHVSVLSLHFYEQSHRILNAFFDFYKKLYRFLPIYDSMVIG